MADRSDSMSDAIDKWEATELEKVEAKAKLLGSIFMGVDHSFMKGTLIKSNNKLGGDAVRSLVSKQREARKAQQQRREEKERLERERRMREQKQRIQAKLEQKFQLIPREEIMKIYDECGNDMEATIDELLYLVALTEASMQKEKARTLKAQKKAKKEAKQKKKQEKAKHKAEKEEKEQEKAPAEEAAEGGEHHEENEAVMVLLDNLSTPDVSSVVAEEEAKAKEIALTLAKEQFESLTKEEIEEILAKHEYKMNEQASAALLEAVENKQVSVLMHAFDKEIEEWEIREVLADHDWDSAATTLELNRRVEERKAQKEAERIKQAAEKERLAKEEEERRQREEEEAKKQRMETAQKRLTLRKMNKTNQLSNKFEEQLQNREQEAKDKIVQQQKLDGARQALVKNLQGMFNPNMLMGGPPPRNLAKPSPVAAPEAEARPKVAFQEPDQPIAETAAASTPEDSAFVDHFLEVRKARAVGAKGRRAPSRKPRGAASKDAPASE